MEATIWAYPWDVTGEGVDSFLDEVQRSGFHRISIAAAYHSGLFVTPRHPRHRVYFPEGGALYFTPRSDKTAPLTLQPRLSRLLHEGEPLRELVDGARRRGLQVHGWFVATHNTHLGETYPDVVQRTVYGDPLYYALCPAQLAVAEYVLTLLAELVSTVGVDGIDLESLNYLGFPHDFHHEKDLVGLDGEANFLLSLCFCRACREEAEVAGVDWRRVGHIVRDRLDEVFQSEGALNRTEESFELMTGHPQDLALDPDVRAYLRVRTDIVMWLFARVRERVGPETKLRIIDWEVPERLWTRGFDGRLNDVLDGVVMCCYSRDTSLLPRLVEQTRRFLPDVPVTGGIQGGYPTCLSAADVEEQILSVKRSAAAGVQVYHYGLMRRENMLWLQQALDGASLRNG